MALFIISYRYTLPDIEPLLQLCFEQITSGSCRHDLRLIVSMMHQVTCGADQLDDVIKFCAGDAGDQVNTTLVGFQLKHIHVCHTQFSEVWITTSFLCYASLRVGILWFLYWERALKCNLIMMWLSHLFLLRFPVLIVFFWAVDELSRRTSCIE